MLQHRQTVLLLGDLVALACSYCIMALVRFNVGAQGDRLIFQLGLFGGLFLVWIAVFFIFDLYNLRRINPNPRNIGMLIIAMAVNVTLAVLIFYFTPNAGISPKTNLAILGISALGLLILWRRLFHILFSRTFVRSIGIIGESPLIEHLKDDLVHNTHIGRIVAHYPDASASVDARINLLIADNVPPHTLLALSRTLGTETLSLARAYEALFGKFPLELMSDARAIHLVTRENNRAIHAIYRICEIIIASVALIISSPFLLVAIVARLIEDGRPIFIKQTRVGKNGVIFNIHKLRSMKALAADGSAEQGGAQWAEKTDTRITPVGTILRKTHIDEVPQMWNIIRGDIALVGPRPERPEFVAQLEQEIPYYYLRHSIRPGFTGWAQIKFRYARTTLDAKEKFEYDLYYLTNKNPLLDFGIFLKTIQIIFTH